MVHASGMLFMEEDVQICNTIKCSIMGILCLLPHTCRSCSRNITLTGHTCIIQVWFAIVWGHCCPTDVLTRMIIGGFNGLVNKVLYIAQH